MRVRRRLGIVLVGVLLFGGCVTPRTYPPPKPPRSARLLDASAAAPDSPSNEETVLRVSWPVAPRNVLVLSGGGRDGAYAAGFLKGWTASGKRPAFDVVTGVSTGALIAPFAFAGAKYDAVLEKNYTQASDKDIFVLRWGFDLFWSDSLALSTPLRRRIEAQYTAELLDEIAQAHRAGRRLYVGTTDLDAKKAVVWDMGAIAASDDANKLALFRKVLLASASVPGVLPPVPIDVQIDGKPYTELHVDGGVSASVFLDPRMIGVRPGCEPAAGANGTNVYVVVSGKLVPEPGEGKRWLVQVSGDALDAILQSRLEGDLLRLFLLARYAEAGFALTAVPDDFQDEGHFLEFDPRVQRQLFDAGEAAGSGGAGWRSVPPGLKPSSRLPPRTGLRFTLDHDAAAGTPSNLSAEDAARLSERLRRMLSPKAEEKETKPGPD